MCMNFFRRCYSVDFELVILHLSARIEGKAVCFFAGRNEPARSPNGGVQSRCDTYDTLFRARASVSRTFFQLLYATVCLTYPVERAERKMRSCCRARKMQFSGSTLKSLAIF